MYISRYKARTRRVPNILRRSPNSKGKPGTTVPAAGLPGFQHPATEPASILPGTTVFLNNPSSSGITTIPF